MNITRFSAGIAAIALLSSCGGGADKAEEAPASAPAVNTAEPAEAVTNTTPADNAATPASDEAAATPAPAEPSAPMEKTAAAPAPAAAPAATPAPAAASKPPVAFAQCALCHKVSPDGAKSIGPNLHGVVGRKAGTQAGFAYSPAMKNSGLTWDAATLDKYLTKPMQVVPGTKMAFAGQPDAGKRKEIIGYLASLK